MRRLIALLAVLLALPAMAETNLAWVPSSSTGDRDIGAWRIPSDASLVVSGSVWETAAIVPFGPLASSAPVWACTGDVQIGSNTGCPAQGFGPKSNVRSSSPPAPPPAPPPPPAVFGRAILTWEAPVLRQDGSPLTNLAGFRIYYGQNSGNLVDRVEIANPAARMYEFSSLAVGLWYFAASAYDAAGLESARSAQVSKDVTSEEPPPPPPPAPVDCVVSAWSAWVPGPWSACVAGSQSRTETRTRTIVTPPANGGAACPVLTESQTVTQSCVPPPPAPVVVPNAGGVQHAVVFGITAAGGRGSTVLGFVPVGTACEGAIVYRYRAQDYRRVPQAAVIWWASTPTANAAAACR